MKRFITKLILVITVLTLTPSLGWAEGVEIDGINYELIPKAKVAHVMGGNYAGDIIIPPSIIYNDTTYQVTSIKNMAFYQRRNLTSVVIPNTITNIGDQCFRGCIQLTSVIMGDGVTTIGKFAFAECECLSKIDLSNNLTNLDYGTFQNCHSLIDIIIPNSVVSLGESMFVFCEKLQSITLPENLTILPKNIFATCRSLKSITIPDKVKIIDNYAFNGCYSLSNIEIPNSVETIRKGAFSACKGLSTVNLGFGIEVIEELSFEDCNQLDTFICHSKIVPLTNNTAFKNSYIDYSTLIVPDESIDAYKSTAPWKDFGTIEGLSGVEREKCATPTITFSNGKLTFICETEGATCFSTIKAPDAGSYSNNEVQLGMTYTVEVYATKPGYDDSDMTTMTIYLSEGAPSIKGDINTDGYVNMSDVTEIINIILGKQQ